MGTFHPGEDAVQSHAGSTRRSIGSAQVGELIPPVAREFLHTARFAALAVVDDHGQVHADLVTGPAGFLNAPSPRTVEIDATPPLTASLFTPGTERTIGMIVLEPWTRRRMRVNGSATRAGTRLAVHTDQVYSNCPKYIQTRTIAINPEPDAAPSGPGAARRARRLTEDQRELIRDADTFFIATRASGHGADASHRGGNPGFVSSPDATSLSWPDYVGNSMYMTLGNLLLEPRCSLLFPDWSSGRTLQLTGWATVDWDPDRAARTPGAQRMVDFDIDRVTEIPDGMPLRWRFGEHHRLNPPVRRATAVP